MKKFLFIGGSRNGQVHKVDGSPVVAAPLPEASDVLASGSPAAAMLLTMTKAIDSVELYDRKTLYVHNLRSTKTVYHLRGECSVSAVEAVALYMAAHRRGEFL